MSVIFLAECGSKQQAEVFSQHFEGISWTLIDDIESECHPEIKQDFEGNWWCSLSATGIDWTPANRAEGNYLHYQIVQLQIIHLQDLKSAPPFRYGFMVELEDKDLNGLLTDSSSQVTYSQLITRQSSENPQIKLNIPTLFVHVVKARLILPEILWQQVGSPSNFEPFIQGYVWLPPSPTIISGGMQAPPKDVITEKTIRIVVDPNQAEIYIQQAHELINQGQFIKALDNLEKAQKLNPFSTEIHRFKAFTLFSLNRFDEALQHCDFAIQFASPQSDNLLIAYQLKGDILYEQGVSLGLLGRHQEAAVAFDNCLKAQVNPNQRENSSIYHNKASALWNSGNWEEGLACYNMAILLNPDYGMAHRDKGSLLQKSGRYEEALLSLNEAVRLMPDSKMAHYLKGICLDMLGYNQEALECFDTAIRLNPHFASAYQGKGIALDKLGRYEEALQSLEYSLQLDPLSSNTQNSIRIVRKHLSFDSF